MKFVYKVAEVVDVVGEAEKGNSQYIPKAKRRVASPSPKERGKRASNRLNTAGPSKRQGVASGEERFNASLSNTPQREEGAGSKNKATEVSNC